MDNRVETSAPLEEVPDDKQYAALNNNAYNQIAHFMNNINENSNQLEIYNFIARLYLPSKSLINWISYSQTIIEEVPDKQYATLNNNAYNQIAHFMNNINENSNQLKIYNFIIGLYLPSKSLMDLISYSQIINLENNEITKVLGDWYRKNECVEQHEQAERKRLELIQLKQLGPKFSEKPHHRAIYTSRPLSFMISDPSSIFSFNLRQGNITEKLNVDIDSIDKSGSFNESSINSFNSSQGYISEDINFDIDNIDTRYFTRSNSQNGTQGHGKRSKTDSNL
ncbi:20841_t:CDS:2 [Rhizophagus irregularis]|nr:20841_t:CDS:2 [Rhizophagus irregularis]